MGRSVAQNSDLWWFTIEESALLLVCPVARIKALLRKHNLPTTWVRIRNVDRPVRMMDSDTLRSLKCVIHGGAMEPKVRLTWDQLRFIQDKLNDLRKNDYITENDNIIHNRALDSSLEVLQKIASGEIQ
jgi:hypothetical protein